MSKLEAIWENLPFHFKQSVVENLDYKDRCSLRKCSSSDRLIVDSTKNVLHDVAIHTCETYSLFSYSDDGKTINVIKYFEIPEDSMLKTDFSISPRVYQPGKNQKIIFKQSKYLELKSSESIKLDDMDFALTDFSIALNHLSCQKMLINDVILADYHPMADPIKTLEFRCRLQKLISDKTQNNKKKLIKTQVLHLKWHQEQDEVVEVLRSFNSDSLHRLELSDRNSTWQMGKIVELEQWKRAQEVLLEVLSDDLTVDHLFHFSQVQTHVRHLEEHDLWRVIKKFIEKNEHGSSFHFTYRQLEPDLQRILSTFNIPIIDQPIRAQTRLRSVLGNRFIHTQRFPMPSQDLVLVVMISEKEVMGTVCRVDQVDVEAKVERGLLR